MRLIWSPEAITDLEDIHSYIASDNAAAADRVVATIVAAVERLLPAFQSAGRPGRIPGTRELVVPRTLYIVPYFVDGEIINVARVYHGARDWPTTLEVR